MDRVGHFNSKVKELLDVSDERELTPEEQSMLQYWNEKMGEQLQVNDRQLSMKDARLASVSPKTTQHRQLYHLRLSLTDKYNFESFNGMMAKFAKLSVIESGSVVYVYEQSGDERADRGHNPHAHIRFKSKLTQGKLIFHVKRCTKLTDAAVKLFAHNNVNALRQYMLGNKGDPDKAADEEERQKRLRKRRQGVQDQIWRIENKLKNEYVPM